jgi:hypothetical protein
MEKTPRPQGCCSRIFLHPPVTYVIRGERLCKLFHCAHIRDEGEFRWQRHCSQSAPPL